MQISARETGEQEHVSAFHQFLRSRDHSAFEVLLNQFAPLVWGVCRRQHLHGADAEDVFQATFLALYQYSPHIRKPASLASWLHGVALRIAGKLKRTSQRQQHRQRIMGINKLQQPRVSFDSTEQQIVDAELARLPAMYREPVLLCYIQGMSQSRAAELLGWPLGTVAGRLSRARKLLHSRLLRRGIAPSLAATLLSEWGMAQVPEHLIAKTMSTVTQGGTPALALLAQCGVSMMHSAKWVLLCVAGIGLTVSAGYAAWYRADTTNPVNGDVTSLISALPANQSEHSDYQAIQGTWRREIRHEVTGTLMGVTDLTFKGRKYAQTQYAVKDGKHTGEAHETGALEFVLDPEKKPKQLELQITDPALVNEDVLVFPSVMERALCLYELQKDTLTITYGGQVPFVKTADGKVIADRKSPLAQFPKQGEQKQVVHVYRRETPVVEKTQATENLRKLELLKAQAETSDTVYQLRMKAYKAGKENINFLLESLRDRFAALTQLIQFEQGDLQKELEETIKLATDAERMAKAKYDAQVVTLLEYKLAQQARLSYEIRLLSHKK
ncbi:MAG: sigma-70 family RNA polymerase sigma factor [Planctomycetia bacterium]|nr:sigma-70 family RNA polymerase sigma factor [Planctomycetia bacterium]